jgi:hypothetical protein
MSDLHSIRLEDIDEESVARLAYSPYLDELLEREGELAEIRISEACSNDLLIRLVADPECPSRRFFVEFLVSRARWPLGHLMDLPYATNRIQGLRPQKEYVDSIAMFAQRIHEHCGLIEQMRVHGSPLLLAIADAILDARHNLPSEVYELRNRKFAAIHRRVRAALDDALGDPDVPVRR